MLVPSSSTTPVVRAPSADSWIRFRQRRIVVLPHPEGPISAVIEWRLKSMLTSPIASFWPYHALIERAESATSAPASTGTSFIAVIAVVVCTRLGFLRPSAQRPARADVQH